MIIKDIVKDGVKIGTITFPEGTSDIVIEEKISQYLKPVELDPDMYLKSSIKERKEYADLMLERFKQKNIKEGINALQGMHMHHMLRAYPVTFMGKSFVIDIMNLAISGDLEIACLCLMYGYTDAGDQPEHWITAERKLWLINEIKSFLGWAQ